MSKRNHLYVIAGQDCNTHSPKIFGAFKHYKQCLDYLNDQGRQVHDNRDNNFDITKFDRSDVHDPCYVTFEHKELFKRLYNAYFSITCMHKGRIHVFKISNNSDFDEIYEALDIMNP